MKKVIVLIAGRNQPDATGFIHAYEKLGRQIDGVLILSRQKGIIYKMRGLIKLMRSFSPGNIKRMIVKFIGFIYGKRSMQALKQTWGNKGGMERLDTMDVISYADSRCIPVYFTNQFNAATLKDITKDEPTLFPLYAGGILNEEILALSNVEFVNAHMGAMPRYRGMNVIEWAVYEDQPTEVSVMIMNKSIDGGDEIMQAPIDIHGVKTILDLRECGFVHCYQTMAKAIDQYSKGEISKTPQPKGGLYYYRMHPIIAKQLEGKLKKQ